MIFLRTENSPRFSHSILTTPDKTARNAAARIARRRTILPAKAFCPRREKGSERKIKCPRKAYLPFIGQPARASAPADQPAAEEISNWGRNFIPRAPSEIAHFRRRFPRAARGLKKFAMPPANCSARQKILWKAKRAFPAAIMLPSGAGARLFIDACRADFDNICAQNIRPSRAIRERKTVCGEQTGGKIEKKRADWKIKWFSATQHARAEIPAQARKKISETRKRGKPRFRAVLRKARAQKKRASPTGEPAFSGYFRYFTASM